MQWERISKTSSTKDLLIFFHIVLYSKGSYPYVFYDLGSEHKHKAMRYLI